MRKGGFSTKRESCLVSKIKVRANLVSNIREVKRKLKSYPGLEQVKDGNTPSYMLRCNKSEERFYTLELDSGSVSINIYSSSSPIYFLQEAVLRLLSVMELTKKEYEFYFEDLYPYLILVLAREQISNYTERIVAANRTIDRTDDADILLAKRVILLTKENARLRKNLSDVEEKNRKLLVNLVTQKQSANCDIGTLTQEIGVDREEIIKALSQTKELGYKAVYKSKDRFELVRL